MSNFCVEFWLSRILYLFFWGEKWGSYRIYRVFWCLKWVVGTSLGEEIDGAKFLCRN